MMPSHRHMTPVRPRAISKAVFDMSKVAATISAQTPVCPSTSDWKTAATNATRKKPVQIRSSTDGC